MKLYYWIALLFLISASVFFNVRGINWGIPSKERMELVFPKQLRNVSFYQLMKESREEIYKFSCGSSLGRLPNSATGTPILKSMGLTENKNVYFNNNEKIMMANFIRPYLLRSEHADEQMTIASLAGMHPKSLDFNPRLFQYGAVYIYGMGTWLGILHILSFVKISPDLSFYFANPEEIGKIFVSGRLLNSIFLALTVIVIFLIAKKIYSERTAILSSLFFCILPIVVYQSHIMKPFIMATFFVTLCVYCSLLILTLEQPDIKKYIFCGIFSGLVIGTIWVYAIVFFIPLLAHFMRYKRITKNLLYFIIAVVFTFFLTNPYWLIKCGDVISEISSFGKSDCLKNWYLIFPFFTRMLPLGIPYSLLVLCAAGIIHTILKKEKQEIFLLVSGCIPMLVFSWWFRGFDSSIENLRFLIPWICIILIFGARIIDILFTNKHVKVLAIFIAIFVVISAVSDSLICSRNFVLDSSSNSTRIKAGIWISENIPIGTTIGTDYLLTYDRLLCIIVIYETKTACKCENDVSG